MGERNEGIAVPQRSALFIKEQSALAGKKTVLTFALASNEGARSQMKTDSGM